jgi:DNA/RNA endonuclease YhcR with UshA esterase domain
LKDAKQVAGLCPRAAKPGRSGRFPEGGQDRPKFGNPETTLRGKLICVTGKIERFRGVAQVTVTKPGQIKPQL